MNISNPPSITYKDASSAHSTSDNLVDQTLKSSLKKVTDFASKTITEAESSLPRKTVNFNQTMRVILIPTRNEYRQANLANQLWRSKNEYRISKIESHLEIQNYARLHSIDIKSARKKLYQPDPSETPK